MAIGDLIRNALASVRDEERYGPADYNTQAPTDDPYAQALRDSQAANRRSRFPQIMEMIGATVGGQNPSDVSDRYQERSDRNLKAAIDRLNESRKRDREDEDYQYTRTQREREGTEWEQEQKEYTANEQIKAERRDPDSVVSQRTRDAVVEMLGEGVRPQVAGMSAADIDQIYDSPRMQELIKSRRADIEYSPRS